MSRRFNRKDRKPRYGGAKPKAKARAKRHESGGAAHDNEHAVRLQKVLAAAGVGSRRECEDIIREGRVDVDGEVVTELGTRVDPDGQRIRVDGEALRRPKRYYYVVNKPSGILSTSKDPSGRPRVIDLTPNVERLFTVGRLDKSSEGLILVTNDGKLTDMLTHPKYGVEKTYLAQVAGVPTPEALAKLRRGVKLAEGFAHARRAFVRRSQGRSSILEMVLDEGRNREVRRLLARVGHKVMKLRRTAIGPLRLGDLKPGESRSLRREEIEELYRAAQEGKRNKARERHEHRKTTAVSETPAQVGVATVRPIIDRSLPIDEFPDELGDLVTESSAETARRQLPVEELEEVGFDETEFDLAGEHLEDDEEENHARHPYRPIEVPEKEEFAAVDLSPIQPGKERTPRSAIIGGDAKRKPGGRQGRKPSRKRHRGSGKPQGRAGEQRRGRR